MRACVQCGLSVGESATFCPVCGALFERAEEIPAMTESSAPFEAAPVVGEPEAPLVTAEPEDAVEESEAAEPAEEPEAAGDPGSPSDTDAEPATEVADKADEVGDVAGLEEPAEAEKAAEDPVERRVAEVSVLLDDAAGCEDADVARAAALYQEAIVGCLEAADDPLASAGVRNELLRGFDGLSSLLERQGLADESLAVVEDAAALGLLNGREVDRTESRDALRERREALRRALFADSAQL